MRYLAFTGDDGEVLAGDGTWVDSEADCDWETIENIPGIDDVITGHGDDCYPSGHVGIGITEPQARLDVFHEPNQVNPKNIGINLYYEDPQEVVHPFVAGIKSHVRRPVSVSTVETYGIWSIADNAIRNRAGFFDARASTVTSGNVGVWGQASGGGEVLQEAVGGRFYGSSASSPYAATYGVIGFARFGQVAYGVYGAASSASTSNWAGYFDGDVHATGTVTWASDETLKQNIESLEGALDVIQQIQPRQYDFQVDAFSQMNLPSGQQQGVIAQELEEVLPNLVKQTTLPAQYDTLGNEIAEAVEYKSVNYVGLIPYLIAGIQEQEQHIGALEDVIDSQNQTLAQVLDQLNDLQQQINNCCSADGDKNFESDNENQNPGLGENILHQNNPNPFGSQTTISYELEQGGKVMLNIFDKNGKPLATLVEAEQQAGEYRYEWDASGLPAGIYNYALYVDGELLVKKAIKLAD